MHKLYSLILLCLLPMISGAQKLSESYFRADAAIYYHDYERAEYWIDSAISLNPRSPLLWLKKGEIQFRKQSFNEALTSFSNAEKFRIGIASYWLAKTYAMLGDTSNAFTELKRHLSIPSKETEANILLDSAFKSIKNTVQWKKIWKEEWYSSNEILFADISYLFSHNEWDHALDILNERMDGRRAGHRLYALRGEAYYHLESYNAAEKDFANALKRSKRNHIYMYWLSKAMLANGKKGKAIKLLNQAIDHSGGEPKYFKQRSIAFANSDEYSQAADDMKHYLSFYPSDGEATELLAEFSYKAGKFIEALFQLGKLIKNQPNNYRFLSMRADIYMKSSNWEMAELDLNKAITLYPEDADVFLRRGICRFNRNSTNEACSDWHKAFSLGNFEAQELIYKHCR